MEELFGYIDSVIFSEPENGFAVARVKEPKKSELTCIVGIMPSLQPGETIRCRGKWKLHPHHGKQFEVDSFELSAPSDLEGIQKFLESGLIKGIGTVYAQRIVAYFRENTFEVIDLSPDRLLEVEGIGKKRVEKIKSSWSDQKSIREVMVFLRGHGVSASLAQKIFKAYGEKSIERVMSNPFQMAKEIFGIGFKSADKIALGLKIEKHSPLRLESGIEHVLWEMSNEGDVCVPKEELVHKATANLEVEPPLIEKQISEMIASQAIIEEEGFVWIRPLYLSEVGIARELSRLFSAPLRLRAVHLEKALVWVQEKLRLRLAPEQRDAVVLSLKEKILIITGGPGTGKSTITKAILAITEKLSAKLLLTAPTGKAAKRMSEITGKKAYTIHSLLEIDPKTATFKRNRESPLECDLLIVDEVSMIDSLLMNHLLKAIPSGARLILIGDIDQLPSVGAGNVLKDLIFSERIPSITLKHIFRQGKGSHIAQAARCINQGLFPSLSSTFSSDFVFLSEEEPERILSEILDLISNHLPKKFSLDPLEQIQVLSPMKRGELGIENLNTLLQERLNPIGPSLLRMGRAFRVGDKVMQIRNNYEKGVFNGDVGRIFAIDVAEQTLIVAFDERQIPYDFSEMDELILAYAVSVHKYQGSEAPCIIIPIHTAHFKMLYRNLLYTAITRGKRLVVLVGSKRALAIAIKNDEMKTRHTGLQKRLKEFLYTNNLKNREYDKETP